MRPIDGDKLKRKVQKVATEAWKMQLTARVETVLNQCIDYIDNAPTIEPSAQPEIIRCKDCEYGEQDEVGRWFCRSLGCQIGNEDGSGFCADAERRTDG